MFHRVWNPHCHFTIWDEDISTKALYVLYTRTGPLQWQ